MWGLRRLPASTAAALGTPLSAPFSASAPATHPSARPPINNSLHHFRSPLHHPEIGPLNPRERCKPPTQRGATRLRMSSDDCRQLVSETILKPGSPRAQEEGRASNAGPGKAGHGEEATVGGGALQTRP